MMTYLSLLKFARILIDSYVYFFFFQAEDGIRDLTVTGVQTCALPILCMSAELHRLHAPVLGPDHHGARNLVVPTLLARRSEERRVGKECRSRWSPYH